MEQLTVKQLLLAHHRINNYLIDPEWYYLHPKKLRDFNRSWGKKVEEYRKKLDDLYLEHFQFKDNKVVTEPVFGWTKKKWMGITVKSWEEVGRKNLTTGKYTEEEFQKIENGILSETVTSW